MLTNEGPKVIEYNCRFGDPECQTIMPLMDKDFVLLLQKCSMGMLTSNQKINMPDKVSGCVIATSGGYPGKYDVGFPIDLEVNESDELQIFDSGTSLNKEGKVVTNGGRVLSVVCQGKNFDEVFDKSYKNLKKINFKGMFYRKDIGHQVRTKCNW